MNVVFHTSQNVWFVKSLKIITMKIFAPLKHAFFLTINLDRKLNISTG